MEAEKTVGLEKIDAKNEVNLDKFSEAEKKRIQDIAGQIDVTDSQALCSTELQLRATFQLSQILY